MISAMTPLELANQVKALETAIPLLLSFKGIKPVTDVAYYFNCILALAAILRKLRSTYARVINYQRLYCTPSPSRVRAHHEDLCSIEMLKSSTEYYESIYATGIRKGFVIAIQSFTSFIYRMHEITEVHEFYAIIANYGITQNMLEALELTNVVEAFILANASTNVPAIEASLSDSSQHLPSR